MPTKTITSLGRMAKKLSTHWLLRQYNLGLHSECSSQYSPLIFPPFRHIFLSVQNPCEQHPVVFTQSAFVMHFSQHVAKCAHLLSSQHLEKHSKLKSQQSLYNFYPCKHRFECTHREFEQHRVVEQPLLFEQFQPPPASSIAYCFVDWKLLKLKEAFMRYWVRVRKVNARFINLSFLMDLEQTPIVD